MVLVLVLQVFPEAEPEPRERSVEIALIEVDEAERERERDRERERPEESSQALDPLREAQARAAPAEADPEARPERQARPVPPPELREQPRPDEEDPPEPEPDPDWLQFVDGREAGEAEPDEEAPLISQRDLDDGRLARRDGVASQGASASSPSVAQRAGGATTPSAAAAPQPRQSPAAAALAAAAAPPAEEALAERTPGEELLASTEASERGEVAQGPLPDPDWRPLAQRITAAPSAPREASTPGEQAEEEAVALVEDVPAPLEAEEVREGPEEELAELEPDPDASEDAVADAALSEEIVESELHDLPPLELPDFSVPTPEGPGQVPRDSGGRAPDPQSEGEAADEPGKAGAETRSGGSPEQGQTSSVSYQLPEDVAVDLEELVAARSHPLAPWAAEVERRIVERLEYPMELRAQRLSGRMVVEFEIQRSGKVVDTRLVRGTGHAELDAIGLFAIPSDVRPPRPFPRRSVRFRYTIRFEEP